MPHSRTALVKVKARKSSAVMWASGNGWRMSITSKCPISELIRDWSETTVVPCCAFGGICSRPEGPRAAFAEFNDVFARHGRAIGAVERQAPAHGRAGGNGSIIGRNAWRSKGCPY